jgi:murein DD-endopeptidase MepM/ murein hydrolase activator NlpD
VLLVSKEGPYGFLVVIDHGNGRQTRYAQLSQFQAEAGQIVQSGQVIGYVGISGRPDIPETHVHFEVRFQSPVGWVAQDPKLHLPANH